MGQSSARMARFLAVLLMLTSSHGLNTFYTVEFPEYSYPAQEVSLVFTIEAPNAVSGPAPLSLTTVLDRSESMQGRKLDLLKKTNQFLVDTMAQNSGKHDLGIVTYSNLLADLVGLQSVTSDTAPLINTLIENMNAAGQTFLSGGLARGLRQQKDRRSDKVQSVYLFTDGLPNVGKTDAEAILNEVRAIRSGSAAPISIYTFGFGEDVDSDLLWHIANEGNGVAYIISKEEDIPVAFGDAIGGLLSAVAQDVKIVFKPVNGASIKEVESPGQISVLDDGSVEVYLSDLFAQETRDILIKMDAPGTSQSGFQELLTVDTTYKDAVSRQVTGEDRVSVGIERTLEPVVVQPAERVEVTKIYFLTSEVLEVAADKAEGDDENGAKEKLDEAERRILDSPLKDRPRLAGLLSDIRKIRGGIVDRLFNRPRRGGILRNLVSSLVNQRSASSNSDRLETSTDSDQRRKSREAAQQGVLGQTLVNGDPAPAPILGPVGQAVGEAVARNVGERVADRLFGSNDDDDDDDGKDDKEKDNKKKKKDSDNDGKNKNGGNGSNDSGNQDRSSDQQQGEFRAAQVEEPQQSDEEDQGPEVFQSNQGEQQQDPQIVEDSQPEEADEGSQQQEFVEESQPQEAEQDSQQQELVEDSQPQETEQDSQQQEFVEDSQPQEAEQDSQEQEFVEDSQPQEAEQDSQEQEFVEDSQPQEAEQDSQEQEFVEDSQPQEAEQDSQEQEFVEDSQPQEAEQDSQQQEEASQPAEFVQEEESGGELQVEEEVVEETGGNSEASGGGGGKRNNRKKRKNRKNRQADEGQGDQVVEQDDFAEQEVVVAPEQPIQSDPVQQVESDPVVEQVQEAPPLPVDTVPGVPTDVPPEGGVLPGILGE
ncbi:hypothetical protein BSKO_13700 [Bryopsis sp. KO-2023]|nr:hypothetical protein BSKO_13700 [Bryopsis sp. KO-2023]